MSKETVKKFFTKLESAPELKKAFTELLGQNQQAPMDTLAEKICVFGKSAGFEFSKAELIAARAEFVENANGNRELSDDDLANVAGGAAAIGSKAGNIAASIVSFGIVCAAISISSANRGDNCAGDLSQKVENYKSYCNS